MKFQRDYISVDSRRQQIQEEGLELFDLAVNDGDVHRYIASVIPLHWHKEIEIFILTEGVVEIGIGDECHVLKEGEGCFINSGVLHSFTARPDIPCRYKSFVFDSSIVSGRSGSIFDIKYIRPLIEEGPRFLEFNGLKGNIRTEFDRAFTACKREDEGFEFIVREALTRVLLEIRGRSPSSAGHVPGKEQEQRIKKLMNWIDGNLEEELTLSDIANAAGISPRECQRLFRSYLHSTPMKYLREQRLLSAAARLSQNDLSITEIAAKYGFASPSYFSSEFRQLVGSTPLEYRRKAEATIFHKEAEASI